MSETKDGTYMIFHAGRTIVGILAEDENGDRVLTDTIEVHLLISQNGQPALSPVRLGNVRIPKSEFASIFFIELHRESPYAKAHRELTSKLRI